MTYIEGKDELARTTWSVEGTLEPYGDVRFTYLPANNTWSAIWLDNKRRFATGSELVSFFGSDELGPIVADIESKYNIVPKQPVSTKKSGSK